MTKDIFLFIKQFSQQRIYDAMNNAIHNYYIRAEELQNVSITYVYQTDLYNKAVAEICKVDCDAECRNTYKYYLSILKLRYQYRNIKLDMIYNRKHIYNGSDPRTYNSLVNAVTFQIAFTYKWSKDLNEKDFEFLCLCYILKLMSNVNNSITYNVPGQNPVYSPIYGQVLKNIISEVKQRLETRPYITFKNGQVYYMDIDFDAPDYHTKRFDKEQLLGYIDSYCIKNNREPTIQELFMHINSFSDGKPIVNSTTNLMYYIDDYELRDKLKMRHRRTKAEIEAEKQNKKK